MNDARRFFRYNLQHYSLALWGLRLRLDPDYPHVTRFLPSQISEPVLEYRTYPLMGLWAFALAAALPANMLTALVLLWACISWDRSKFYRSELAFWRQVYKENGVSHQRGHGRLMEAITREIERRMKAGESWEELTVEGFRIQDDVLRYARRVQGLPTANVESPRPL